MLTLMHMLVFMLTLMLVLMLPLLLLLFLRLVLLLVLMFRQRCEGFYPWRRWRRPYYCRASGFCTKYKYSRVNKMDGWR